MTEIRDRAKIRWVAVGTTGTDDEGNRWLRTFDGWVTDTPDWAYDSPEYTLPLRIDEPPRIEAAPATEPETVAELREWLAGKRSMTNHIHGTVGDPEIETRLIWEADTARISALAALVNYETAKLERGTK